MHRSLIQAARALVLIALSLAAVVQSAAGATPTRAPVYRFTDLSADSGFSTGTFAVAINNHQQVLDRAGDIWQNGTWTPISTVPDAYFVQTIAINDRGQVTGILWTYSGLRAFVWSAGTTVDLGTLPGGPNWSTPSAINNLGTVVGSSFSASGQQHAFLWQNGAMADLGVLPGGTNSTATGINDLGQVVGTSTTAGGQSHAFLWEAGQMTDLGTLTGPNGYSGANAINSHRQVAGLSRTADGRVHPYLWQNGAMTDIGSELDGDANSIAGINDGGQVAGTISNPNGQHIFLWQNGVMSDVGTLPSGLGLAFSPGIGGTLATGINNAGFIIANSMVAGPRDELHPVLMTPGSREFAGISLNGTSGYAEVANSPDLNLSGDWTVEGWFKDEDPNGFNHDYREILMKGDRKANPEAPYYMLIGYNHLLAGIRTSGQDYPVLDFNLVVPGLIPGTWHQVAVSSKASTNEMDLWIDGTFVRWGIVPAHSTTGNSLPLEIGRNGPVTGKYWVGKIDNVRIWNVARTDADIAANWASEFSGPQTGLVANWLFNEASGRLAADTSGHGHTAILNGGAIFAPNP